MHLVKKEAWELMQPGFCYLNSELQSLPPLGHRFPGCSTRMIILTHLSSGKHGSQGRAWDAIKSCTQAYVYVCVCVCVTLRTAQMALKTCQGWLFAKHKLCEVIWHLFLAFFHWSKWKKQAVRFCSLSHATVLKASWAGAALTHAGFQSEEAHGWGKVDRRACLPMSLIAFHRF